MSERKYTYLLTYSCSGGPGWSLAASTSCLHLRRSWAMMVHSWGFSTPSIVRSLRTQSAQRSRGRPGGRRPCGVPSLTLRARLFGSIRATWPAHRSLWDLTKLVTGGRRVISLSSRLCRIRHSCVSSSRTGPRIRRSTLCSNTRSRRSSSLVRAQASQAYVKTSLMMVQ